MSRVLAGSCIFSARWFAASCCVEKRLSNSVMARAIAWLMVASALPATACSRVRMVSARFSSASLASAVIVSALISFSGLPSMGSRYSTHF